MNSLGITESWVVGDRASFKGGKTAAKIFTPTAATGQFTERWLRRAALPHQLRAKPRPRRSTSSPRKWSCSVPATLCSAWLCGESTIRWVCHPVSPQLCCTVTVSNSSNSSVLPRRLLFAVCHHPSCYWSWMTDARWQLSSGWRRCCQCLTSCNCPGPLLSNSFIIMPL